MDAAFNLLANHQATIQYPPPVVGGKRGDGVSSVGPLQCLPLDYVSARVAQRLGLDAPARLRQTYIDGNVVIPRSSILVMDGKSYPILATEPWDWLQNGSQYTHLVVEATEA